MKILVIGDIISQVGCDFLQLKLPQVKQKLGVDLVIANGENSAIGNGITPHSADHLLKSGVDVITTGNHVFKRHEILNYLDVTPHVIRPANFPEGTNGLGYYIYDGGSFSVCVINIMGTSYMEPLDCPFQTMDTLLKEIDCKTIIVDFHAEATGEKKALGYYLDGQVSAFLGTHTHCQTADEQILPQGTAYITDIGMTGPIDSVLGIIPECVINRLKSHMPTRFEVADSKCQMDCVLLDIDKKTGKCEKIERLQIK